jgi:hypothetical protein
MFNNKTIITVMAAAIPANKIRFVDSSDNRSPFYSVPKTYDDVYALRLRVTLVFNMKNQPTIFDSKDDASRSVLAYPADFVGGSEYFVEFPGALSYVPRSNT